MERSIDRFMTEIILAAIDQKRASEWKRSDYLSRLRWPFHGWNNPLRGPLPDRWGGSERKFKTPLTYRWLIRFRSMLSSAFPHTGLPELCGFLSATMRYFLGNYAPKIPNYANCTILHNFFWISLQIFFGFTFYTKLSIFKMKTQERKLFC